MNNAHTHCPTCIDAATEYAFDMADDDGRTISDAQARVTAIAHLDRIITEQSLTRSTNPSNTCFFMH